MANKSGLAVAGLGAGCIFVMSGLKGWSISTSLKDLLTGVNPSTQPQVNAITNPNSPVYGGGTGNYAGGSASNSAVVSAAEEFLGGPYGYGDSGPPGTPNDCSGLVNYVLGKMLGLDIPGCPNGKYSGHGPVTMQYWLWLGATTVPQSQAQPGDLASWMSHIGIFVTPTTVLSALDQQSGVVITSIAGATPSGDPTLKVRRINEIYSSNPPESISQQLADITAHVSRT
jgi:cell wall-associated NlpC family hydrolase